MSQEVRIVSFQLNQAAAVQAAEQEITRLLNERWVIVTAGGTGAGWGESGDPNAPAWVAVAASGFVILQRYWPEAGSLVRSEPGRQQARDVD